MAVLSTTVWRVHPGKMQDFMGHVTTAKKIFGRLGGHVRVLNEAVGSNAPAFIFVVECGNWKDYGDMQTKMETDSEWQRFFVEITSKPSADLIGTGLMSEVPIG